MSCQILKARAAGHQSVANLPGAVLLAACRTICLFASSADIDRLSVFAALQLALLIGLLRNDRTIMAGIRVDPARGMSRGTRFQRAVRRLRHIGPIRTIEGFADLAADDGAQQHTRTRCPETSGTATDLRAKQTATHRATQRSDALFRPCAAIHILIAGRENRQRNDTDEQYFNELHGVLHGQSQWKESGSSAETELPSTAAV